MKPSDIRNRTAGLLAVLALVSALATASFTAAGCSAQRAAPGAGTTATVTSTATSSGPAAPAGSATETGAQPATSALLAGTAAPAYEGPPISFAVIGDYGTGDRHAAAVAKLVASWKPEFIVALGDDYYAAAGGRGAQRYVRSTGQFYGRWVQGVGAKSNAFYAAMGNHDYSDAKPSPKTYLDYFTLPGGGLVSSTDNERYYDFVRGPIHFFVLDTADEEPAGITTDSPQAQWLRSQLATSTSTFNVVVGHHPPYSSDVKHGSEERLRWPYGPWGADLVLSGHSHTYERFELEGITYIVDGLGGARRYRFEHPLPGSVVRYRDDWGALKVTATGEAIDLAFYNTRGRLIDRYRIAARR